MAALLQEIPKSQGEVLLMQCLDPGKMIVQEGDNGLRKSCYPVLCALSRPDGDLLHFVVNILDAYPYRFHYPEGTPIQQFYNPLP